MQNHPGTIQAISGMGGLLIREGHYTEAEPFYREALDKLRHPRPAKNHENFQRLLPSWN
jgi:hypothetical protein